MHPSPTNLPKLHHCKQGMWMMATTLPCGSCRAAPRSPRCPWLCSTQLASEKTSQRPRHPGAHLAALVKQHHPPALVLNRHSTGVAPRPSQHLRMRETRPTSILAFGFAADTPGAWGGFLLHGPGRLAVCTGHGCLPAPHSRPRLQTNGSIPQGAQNDSPPLAACLLFNRTNQP